jgi:fumarate hydratase, class II
MVSGLSSTIYKRTRSEYLAPSLDFITKLSSFWQGLISEIAFLKKNLKIKKDFIISLMRIEKDSMGEMQVPETALYGASTQRAVLNFPIMKRPMPAEFIKAVGLLKWASAKANNELHLLDDKRTALIEQAALEVANGDLLEHFPVDVFQTGSCTSTNINANEVIANRISQIEGNQIGSKDPVHPNDHVNMCQSSNDTMPTALHLSVALALQKNLRPSLAHMAIALEKKAKIWAGVVKIGRTHLMDATPVTLGQVFAGYARQVRKGMDRVDKAIAALSELAIGGTAVGTGINAHPEFGQRVCRILSEKTGIFFRKAESHFEAQSGRDDCVEVAGQINAIAASLTKIANDIRLMASGPRCGLEEIRLPSTQPGSSIMPGKVNPVMSEMLVQICIYVNGLMQMVNFGGRDGHFELNVNIPIIAYALLEAISNLTAGIQTFTDRCVQGIEANVEHCRKLVDHSLMLVTALNPYIGYDKAAYVAKKAFNERRSLKAILIEEKIMPEAEIDKALDPMLMLKPDSGRCGKSEG